MTCDEVRELLVDELDGTLPAERAIAVAAHLGECGACREEHEALREAEAAVRLLPRAAAPADFLARLNARIDAEAAAAARPAAPEPLAAAPAEPRARVLEMPRRRWAAPRALAGLAAAALLAVGVSLVQFGTKRQAPLAPPETVAAKRVAPDDAAKAQSAIQAASGRAAGDFEERELAKSAHARLAASSEEAIEKLKQSVIASREALDRFGETRVTGAAGDADARSKSFFEIRTLTVASLDPASARVKVMATLARNSVTAEPTTPLSDAREVTRGESEPQVLVCDVSPAQYASITNDLGRAPEIMLRYGSADSAGFLTYDAKSAKEITDGTTFELPQGRVHAGVPRDEVASRGGEEAERKLGLIAAPTPPPAAPLAEDADGAIARATKNADQGTRSVERGRLVDGEAHRELAGADKTPAAPPPAPRPEPAAPSASGATAGPAGAGGAKFFRGREAEKKKAEEKDIAGEEAPPTVEGQSPAKADEPARRRAETVSRDDVPQAPAAPARPNDAAPSDESRSVSLAARPPTPTSLLKATAPDADRTIRLVIEFAPERAGEVDKLERSAEPAAAPAAGKR
jgi:negative regulator of sigma E activity